MLIKLTLHANNSLEQSPSQEPNSFSRFPKNSPHFMKLGSPLPTTCPYPEPE